MMNPLAQIIQDMRYFLIDKANTPSMAFGAE